MGSWIMTTLVWLLLSASIYFIGHLQQLQLSHQYDVFTETLVAASTNATGNTPCHPTLRPGLLLTFDYCVRGKEKQFLHQDRQGAVLQDLAIANELLVGAQVDYEQINSSLRGFSVFLKDLDLPLSLSKTLFVLADEGSSSSPSKVVKRLDNSTHVWGGVVNEAQQEVRDYASYLKANDGVWRSTIQRDWLRPWQDKSPDNQLRFWAP